VTTVLPKPQGSLLSACRSQVQETTMGAALRLDVVLAAGAFVFLAAIMLGAI
jgi:hypothetical protein